MTICYIVSIKQGWHGKKYHQPIIMKLKTNRICRLKGTKLMVHKQPQFWYFLMLTYSTLHLKRFFQHFFFVCVCDIYIFKNLSFFKFAQCKYPGKHLKCFLANKKFKSLQIKKTGTVNKISICHPKCQLSGTKLCLVQKTQPSSFSFLDQEV